MRICFPFFSLSAVGTKREKRTAARVFGSQSSDRGNSRLLMPGRREILHERPTCFVYSKTKVNKGKEDSGVLSRSYLRRFFQRM